MPITSEDVKRHVDWMKMGSEVFWGKEDKEMSELKKEWFKVCKHQCCKCNDKPKFVVGKDVKEGELGFYLHTYFDGSVGIRLSNGQNLLGINPSGTFERYSWLDNSIGLQLDGRERIKVSE